MWCDVIRSSSIRQSVKCLAKSPRFRHDWCSWCFIEWMKPKSHIYSLTQIYRLADCITTKNASFLLSLFDRWSGSWNLIRIKSLFFYIAIIYSSQKTSARIGFNAGALTTSFLLLILIASRMSMSGLVKRLSHGFLFQRLRFDALNYNQMTFSCAQMPHWIQRSVTWFVRKKN